MLSAVSHGAEVISSTGAPELRPLVDAAVQKTLAAFAGKKLLPAELAVTLIDLRDGKNKAQASYRGQEQIYPASVIKLFYLAAAHRWMEDRKIEDTAELRRAMSDMIVHSYNEATGYVVDVLTGTTSGPELPEREMQDWWEKRNAVNRYFTSLGYTNINANKKPWCEGPYGRETQAVKLFSPKRNFLTTEATARLLSEIATGQAVTAPRCAEMMKLLERAPMSKTSDPDDQSHGFTGPAVGEGGRIWSKAGWTSDTRHDAAYVELPNGAKFVLVTFTINHASERAIIPTLAREIVGAMNPREGRLPSSHTFGVWA